MLGFSYDWDREVDTTDPEYFKWTQWIFLQLFKKGLAYESQVPVWWCEGCKAVLANEEVNADGTCERKGHRRRTAVRSASGFSGSPPTPSAC